LGNSTSVTSQGGSSDQNANETSLLLMSDGSSMELRVRLGRGLRSRRGEMETVLLERLNADADPTGRDTEYRAGLRAVVSAVLDYAIMAIEHDDEWLGTIPSVAILQTRLAAQRGLTLETVLLGYVTGHRCLCGFLIEEADQLPGQVLRCALDIQGLLLTELMTAVSCEYKAEVEQSLRTADHRRAERVRKLLSHEMVDVSAFDYEFADVWHVGVIALGLGARTIFRGLTASFDCQFLFAQHGEKTVWAWLGNRSRPVLDDVISRLTALEVDGTLLALGEPSRGLPGWRLTHQQAQAALLVAIHKSRGITSYSEVMLLAAALQDDTLARSLEDVYLAPLAGHRAGETVLVDTLRAYFAAQRSVAGTAASMGLQRHTVQRRLRAIEKRLERLLHTCDAELQLALSLRDFRAL
jgi:hypothetical protein